MKLTLEQQYMFNWCLRNAANIQYSLLKFGHMHLCGIDYKYFLPHCCKYNSFGCIAAIRCGSACHGSHNDSAYSGSKHDQFDSPRLVKRETGFLNPRRVLIGSYQLWRVMPHHTTENMCQYTNVGSGNGLSPGQCQAIIWTNAGILLNWPLGTNFSEILIEIYTFSVKKMHLKMSGKFCLRLNVLRYRVVIWHITLTKSSCQK